MKFCIAVLLLMSLAGCTDSSKYIKIRIDKGACLHIDGDINPAFLREGTTESDSQTISPSTDFNLNKNATP